MVRKVVPSLFFDRIHDSPLYIVAGAEEKCFSIKSGMSLLGHETADRPSSFLQKLSPGENH